MSVAFFFNDTATTEIYTLSLHDALPICRLPRLYRDRHRARRRGQHRGQDRSEEHTSELQSHSDIVCRLLLEKKTRIACRHAQRGSVPEYFGGSAASLAPAASITRNRDRT